MWEGKVFSVMTSGFLVWIFAISTILLVNFVIFYPMENKRQLSKGTVSGAAYESS